MLSRSGNFNNLTCPDENCQRLYCHFGRHGPVAADQDQRYKVAAPIAASSSIIQISQDPIASSSSSSNDYYGHYAYTSKSVNYDPFSTNSYGLYAPVAPSYSPVESSYTPVGLGFDFSNEISGPAASSYSSDSVSEGTSFAPSYSRDYTFDGGYHATDGDGREPSPEPRVSKTASRKSFDDFEDPNKPKLPPDLANDELLQFNHRAKAKSEYTTASKKARKPLGKPMKDSRPTIARNITEMANDSVKKITEIDRQLDEIRRAKEQVGKTKRPVAVDIDDLFAVDDEPANSKPPAPKKIRTVQPSSSTSFARPNTSTLSYSSCSSSSNDDIQIICEKPASDPKGSRVAHQPQFARSLPTSNSLRRKPKLQEMLEKRIAAAAESKPTVALSSGMLSAMDEFKKGQPRIAHVPKPAVVSKPITTTAAMKTTSKSAGSTIVKAPIAVNAKHVTSKFRQQMLEKLMNDYSKLMPVADALSAAQNQELSIIKSTTTLSGYKSGITGALLQIREMVKTGASPKAPKASVSHSSVLTGKYKEQITVGVNRHLKSTAERVNEFTEQELYEALFDKYLMTDEQLEENGYPLWTDDITRESVRIKPNPLDGKYDPYVDSDNPFRLCCRCKKKYRVKLKPDDDVETEQCQYHWGKFWSKKYQGTFIKRFTCCDGGQEQEGCTLANEHVTQMLPKTVFRDFVEAPPRKSDYDERSNRVVALDCEMVYTSLGPAVARLSVVNYQGTKILDEIIKPPGTVTDTNYRFSGLQMEEVVNAKLNLAEVQQRFFEIVNRDSILIGHSLESDLKAMRIVHRNVVDTTILYPHRLGPPMKRALKNLSTEVLQEIIQEDITGHDSAEDAIISLRLVIAKLKNG